MLDRFLQPESTTFRKLTVYADNCGGQNKNNHVLKYFLLLAHTGFFDEVHYKFFVRGHTKNSCDRGFGMLKKKLAHNDCWSLEQLQEILDAASIDTETDFLDKHDAPFTDFKASISELYRNLPAIQKYQIFLMYHSKPGVVECRQTPLSQPDVYDIRRSYDGVRVSPERAQEIYSSTEVLPAPAPNPEKIQNIYKDIRPYVPEQYKSSSLYTPPTSVQAEAAQDIKRARVTHRAGEKARYAKATALSDMQASVVRQKAAELEEARQQKRKKAGRKHDSDDE